MAKLQAFKVVPDLLVHAVYTNFCPFLAHLSYANHCTLVQNETVSFRNYFDVFIATKVLYFEPTYISGIKSV